MEKELTIEETFKELNNFEISDIVLFDDVSKIDIYYDDDDLDGTYQEINESETHEKYRLSRERVEEILVKLKNCSSINQNDYYKTYRFLSENSLTLDDCLEIIQNLTIEDYYANTTSTNPDHLGDNLIIFEPEVTELSDGRIFTDLIVYLKIDLDKTTNEAVALVSIHRGTPNNLPYRRDTI